MLRMCLALCAAASASCQRYEDLKQRWIAPPAAEQPWQRVAPTTGEPIDAMSGQCTIPVHDDDYYGFSVGRPNGWQLDYSTGTLIVSPDARQLVGAMVFPARLRRTDLTADQLAAMFADKLAAQIRSNGGTFELSDKVSDGRVAHATATATLGGVKVKGPLQVIETPGFMTLKLYWAPEADLAADEPTLRQILACFKRKTLITARHPVAPAGGASTRVGVAKVAEPVEPTAALHPYRGKYIAMQWPANWEVSDETDHGIDIIDKGRNAALSFTYLIGSQFRADVAAMRILQRYYPTTHVVTSGWQVAPPGWQIAAIEFVGPVNGITLHGYVRVAAGNGAQLSTSWVANDRQWTQLRPMLESMAASVQIQPAAIAQVRSEVRAQLASYPPIVPSTAGSHPAAAASSSGVMSKWENDDKNSQAWSDSMLNQDRAKSPTTGEEYVVPYNAWSSSGPQGAGYYRATPGGGSERLDVQGTDYPQ